MEADQAAAGAVLHTTRPGPSVLHTPVKPVIIMLSGLPGTGKTFLSHQLAERLGFLTVESDAIRKELFPRPSYSTRESASLFRAVHCLIKETVQNGLSLIFDATNLEERYRKIVYRIAGRTGARLILVEVEAPPQTVQNRLKDRLLERNSYNYSDATWEIYQRMKKSAEKIRLPHYTVDTTGDITPIIEKIVKEANRG
jgi:predicted kinase